MAMDSSRMQDILGGVDYPIGKDQMVQYLHDNGVSENLVQSVERTDRDQFNSPTDVTDVMGA